MSTSYTTLNGADYDNSEWTVPSKRVFREAWEAGAADTKLIEINMDKAKEIWRDKIREARVEPLAALDTAFMKALETGADTSSIVAQKQALRDAPADPAIDAATTPDELKAVKPAGLKVE